MHLLMIRPSAFGFSIEAASTNLFQQRPENEANAVAAAALREFDRMAAQLKEVGLSVIVVEDSPDPPKPDAVFPNNWVSWHEDGRLVLYPMAVPSRRSERRPEVLDAVAAVIGPSEVVDLRHLELQGEYVEGTGSLVLDRRKKLAFAVESPRTTRNGVARFCAELGFRPVFFEAEIGGMPVYHTNVALALGPDWALYYGEGAEKELEGREILKLERKQVMEFAANVLWVEGHTLLSRRAWEALRRSQQQRIGKCCVFDIPTIETVGGGSVRCMLAEVTRGLTSR